MSENSKEGKNVLTIREERIEDIENLRKRGIDPFGSYFPNKEPIMEVIDKFSRIAAGEPTTETVLIAGRVMGLRKHGKAVFADLEDQTGKMQIYVKSNLIGEESLRYLKVLR